MSDLLRYDNKNMWQKSGREKKNTVSTKQALRTAYKTTEAHRLSDTQGWMEAPFSTKTRKEAERLATEIRGKFKRLLVIGIGGSDLGARTLVGAVGDGSFEICFLSNPDPETVSAFLKQPTAWWKETAVNVVSKSGTTLETMSIFLVVRDRLIKAVGRQAHGSHIYATTEVGVGALYTYAKREGYTIVAHPLNVGGRFSVFTIVGLLPAACAGVDLKKLLKGAVWMETKRRTEGEKSAVARYALAQALAYDSGAHIHVLMPYADRLTPVGFWYRQLWSESLGKIRKGIPTGPTAIAAFGAVDQHSQIQLYNEGPNNKTVTFIEVETLAESLIVPQEAKNVEGFSYAAGKTLTEILHAEREGTARALTQNGRLNSTITIPKITPESIGALLQFFMGATAYTGELLGVNPYDQPGVEAGKREAKKLLSAGL